MGVFTAALATGGTFLRDATITAAHELGVFGAILAGAGSLDELAAAVGAPARPRLRALIDVLAALEVLETTGRYRVVAVPPAVSVPRHGWGRLAEVIRADRPLPLDDGDLERHQRHLVTASAAAARELTPLLRGPTIREPRLLDLGGGAGAYTSAFLDAFPTGTATLVDLAPVVPLAAAELARHDDRVSFVTGDARTAPLPGGQGAVLLANVLHLHPPAACRQLCAAAARAIGSDGVVAVVDLRVDDDRRGPIEGLWFALAMAIYTDGGDVYPTAVLRQWLEQAGLAVIDEHRLEAAPEVIVVTGRRA